MNDDAAPKGIVVVLRGKIEVCCSPEMIWPYISDSGLILLWNERMKTIVPMTPGPWAANSMFRMRYEYGGRAGNFLGEILEYQRPVRIAVHLKGGFLPAGAYLQEIYELMETNNGALLKQEISTYGSGQNFLSAVLLFVSHHLPRSCGKVSLLKLKELAERSGPALTRAVPPV